MKRSTPLRRGKPMRRSGRLRSARKGNRGAAGRPSLPRADYRALVDDLEARCGGRCENPRCRRRVYLEAHHIVKRSAGGQDSADNIVLLCHPDHRSTDDKRQGLGVRGLGAEMFAFKILSEFHGDAEIIYYRPRAIR